ncbi:MAG: hypothetical protein LBI63_01700 [Candidatus Ancillula sp.]|nr:hypothetical protein [Candidatus Ancillula sp.]
MDLWNDFFNFICTFNKYYFFSGPKAHADTISNVVPTITKVDVSLSGKLLGTGWLR